MSEPNYHARAVNKIDNGKGRWESLEVGVFDGETRVGSYVRNYPSLLGTFFPFKAGDRWLALYSRDYTATRVMSLPDCADLGGEERASHGFCPMEYLVPELTGQETRADDPRPLPANHDRQRWAREVTLPGGGTRLYWPDEKEGHAHLAEEFKRAKEESHEKWDAWFERTPFVTRYADWGLVAGCNWGDDSSMKVQYLGLSRAAEGIVTRDQRFGYLELPAGVGLKDGVHTDNINDLNAPPGDQCIEIAVPVRFDLTGKRLGD